MLRSRPRLLLIGVAVVLGVLLVAGADLWIVGHFGANAAAQRAPDSYLNAIACPSADQCWAVGQTASIRGDSTRDKTRAPLVEQETAGRWHVIPVPHRESKDALEGIACPGPADCWVVGGSARRAKAMILHWDGLRWHLMRSPYLRAAQLNSVSCASAQTCWAIGGTQTSLGTLRYFMERWNGQRWSIIHELPGGLQPTAISCPVRGYCLAVGRRHGAAAAASYSRGHWTAVAAPGDPRAAAVPTLLGCAGPARCLAVFTGSTPRTDIWNGRAWTSAATRLPAHSLRLTCTGPGHCWIAGMSAAGQPQLERWQGGRWVPVTVPAGRNPTGFLNDIACAASCWAAGGTGGSHRNGSSYTYPLLEPVPGT